MFHNPHVCSKFYKPIFSDITDLINRSPDPARPMSQNTFSGTFFAPINGRVLTSKPKAEEKGKVELLLPYHVALDFKPFPFGFNTRKQFSTLLKGHGLVVHVTK